MSCTRSRNALDIPRIALGMHQSHATGPRADIPSHGGKRPRYVAEKYTGLSQPVGGSRIHWASSYLQWEGIPGDYLENVRHRDCIDVVSTHSRPLLTLGNTAQPEAHSPSEVRRQSLRGRRVIRSTSWSVNTLGSDRHLGSLEPACLFYLLSYPPSTSSIPHPRCSLLMSALCCTPARHRRSISL